MPQRSRTAGVVLGYLAALAVSMISGCAGESDSRDETARHDEIARLVHEEVTAELDRREREQCERDEKADAAAQVQEREALASADSRGTVDSIARQEKARVLSTPAELDHVTEIRTLLEKNGLGGLNPMNTEFAVSSVAAPLLVDDLFEAAELHVSSFDDLAARLRLTPYQKIQFVAATGKRERMRIAQIVSKIEKGGPLSSVDVKYGRESPFLEPLVVESLKKNPPQQ
jgi:hypothetical protein